MDYDPCPTHEEQVPVNNNEVITRTDEDEEEESTAAAAPPADADADADVKLGIAFVSLVIIGTANSVLRKLVAIPLYNYPNFINMFNLVLYLIVCFSYILFVTKFIGPPSSSITAEQMQFPKRSFALMGLLDTLSISIQQISCVYLSGPMLILLPQAAIPISMIFSRNIKGERFHYVQYFGAAIVTIGILIVLEPMMRQHSQGNALDYVCETNSNLFDPEEYCSICQVESSKGSCLSHNHTTGTGTGTGTHQQHRDDQSPSATAIDLLCEWVPIGNSTAATSGSDDTGLVITWSLVVIASCIPMTLSSLYKEIVLSKIEFDPLFLNGWSAVFQFIFSFALALPAGMLSSPPVPPKDLPRNMADAWDCYYNGRGTVDTGCHPDDSCGRAFWLFNLSFVIILLYTVLAIYVLKYGSTSLFYLALTITVPLGNLAFCIPTMPGYTPMQISDILGLLVIVTGLVLYRTFSERDNTAATVANEGTTVDLNSSVLTSVDGGGGDDDDGILTSTTITNDNTNTMEALQEPLLESSTN